MEPIGNLTSQYFANYYLSFADRFIQQELKIKLYVRYMDDMVLWSNDKEHLLKVKKSIEQFLSKELALTLKINILQRNTHGLSFLGYRIFKDYTQLAKKSKNRFISKTKFYKEQLDKNIYTQLDYQKHILPLIAYTKHAETHSSLNPQVYFYYKHQLPIIKGNARFSILTITGAMFPSLKTVLTFTNKHLTFS